MTQLQRKETIKCKKIKFFPSQETKRYISFGKFNAKPCRVKPKITWEQLAKGIKIVTKSFFEQSEVDSSPKKPESDGGVKGTLREGQALADELNEVR